MAQIGSIAVAMRAKLGDCSIGSLALGGLACRGWRSGLGNRRKKGGDYLLWNDDRRELWKTKDTKQICLIFLDPYPKWGLHSKSRASKIRFEPSTS